MGKKKSRRGQPKATNQPSPQKVVNPVPEYWEQDDIGKELGHNSGLDKAVLDDQQEIQIPLARKRSHSAFSINFDEFDEEVDVPIGVAASNLPPKHSYQTVYMSHENVTSPTPTKSAYRSDTISSRSNKTDVDIPTMPQGLGRSRLNSFSSNYNTRADGGAYEEFRASQQSLKSNSNAQLGGGDAQKIGGSRRSLYSAASGERSLAGFPKSSFGGSRASVNASRSDVESYDDGRVHIFRDLTAFGELEALRGPTRSRTNSRVSGSFSRNDEVLNEGSVAAQSQEMKPRLPRSRTVSESSKKDGVMPELNTATQSVSQIMRGQSEDVRTYNADSDYLQHGLSKLSIHTNNDEFVLVGGHPSTYPEDFGGRSNIPAIRVNDDTFHSSVYSQHQEDVSTRSNISRSKSVSRNELSKNSFGNTAKYGSNRYLENSEAEDDIGRSFSQRTLSKSSVLDVPISRTNSRHSIHSNSNTDDRLLLAAKYSQLPEAEGLVPIPITRSRCPSRSEITSNSATLVPEKQTRLSRSHSQASNVSERVNFAEIPTLYSHPDEHFGADDDEPGVPFRSTSEHQFTPSNVVKRRSVRESTNFDETETEEPPKALIVTSALTPVVKRNAMTSASDITDYSLMKTPDTVQRVQEPRFLRKIVQPLEKNATTEIAIQTGDTIRLRQGRWNVDVLSEFADIGSSKSIDKQHASPVSSEHNVTEEIKSSRSNSSHQVTMVHASNSNSNVLKDRLRYIAERYQDDDDKIFTLVNDENTDLTNDQFNEGLSPMSTSTPAKQSLRRMAAVSGDYGNGWQNEGLQKTGSEKSVNSGRKSETNPDAKWVEGTKVNGDTIRKHVPRGRIRDLANAFENLASPLAGSNKQYVYNTPKSAEKKFISNSDVSRCKGTSSNRLDGSMLSSNAFRTSQQTIDSDRRRSTSSGSHQFTRNTFLRGSNVANEKKMNVHQELGKGDNSGFLTMFERYSSSQASISPKYESVPIQSLRQVYETKNSSGDHLKSHNIGKPPMRGDLFRRSMPIREPIGRNNSPILRRQTTTIDDAIPKGSIFLEGLPKTNSTRDFRFGSNVEIPKSKQTVEVPIRKMSNTSSQNEGFENSNTKSYVEVPIGRQPKSELTRKRFERAKTQEVGGNVMYGHEPKLYEMRAASREEMVYPVNTPFLSVGSKAFGRSTQEDLSDLKAEKPKWAAQNQQKKQINMFEERRQLREEEERSQKERDEHHGYPYSRPLAVTPTIERNNNSSRTSIFEKHPSQLNLPTNLSRHASSAFPTHQTYSPPATDDAGSRITHNTMHDDVSSYGKALTTEDSSIRGKIDRLFDFVEDDSSRKHTTRGSTIDSILSSDTIGKCTMENRRDLSPKKNAPLIRQRSVDDHTEWSTLPYNENTDTMSQFRSDDNRENEMSPRRRAMERLLQSPERRNTIGGTDVPIGNGLEYSLSQYREMQREQLRRLPSAEDPQYFRSPSLTAPHAGQFLHAYRSRDILGTPTSGEKVRLNSSNNFEKRVTPIALATSTPMDSPQSVLSYSMRSREMNNNNGGKLFGSAQQPQNETFVSSISGVSTADKQADVMRRINRLSYMIENTQKQMTMNEAALTDALKKGRQSQEIAAHRSILISRETLRLQRSELRRLHAISAVRRPPPPVARELRGNVVFRNILVHLNRNFCSRLTAADNNSHAFVALFKCGHQVEATEYVTLRVGSQNEELVDKISFEKQIQFSDVPVDFSVTVEFYAMRVQSSKPTEHSLGTSFAMRCKSLIGPPQKKQSNVSTETAFKVRGRIVLDRDASGDRCFYLDDVNYPLEGTVTISTRCSRLPDAFEVDFRGFLTMFSTISEMASWNRFWAVLRRGVVFFWKYPDDEQMGKEPEMQIDLTKCTNNTIESCTFDVCPRPHSFAVEILVETEESTIGSVVEKRRVLLSADSSEMLKQWLFAMNQTLDVIRGPI